MWWMYFSKVKQGIIHPHIAVNVNRAPLGLALEAILSAESMKSKVCAVNAQWLQNTNFHHGV